MSSKNYALLSLRLLVVIITLAVSSSAQTNTTNSNGKTPSGMAPGSPSGSYPLSGFENINLFNGNLSFHLPLMVVGGRGSLSSAIMLGLNTKNWRVNHFHRVMPDESEIDWFTPTQSCTGASAGYGPGYLTGKRTGIFTSSDFSCGTRYSKTLSRLNFVLPDGTEIELRDQFTGGEPKSVSGYACNSGFDRGTVFVTADGTSATFISDTAITDNGTLTAGCGGGFQVSGFMLLRDGTRYRIDNGLITWARDRNGNKISYTYDAFGRVITITDAVNRQITINYDVSDVAPYGLCDQIIFKGAGGVQRIIRISKTALANAFRPNSGFSVQTHQQLFPELNHSSTTTTHNPTVVSKVWLPNSDGTGQHYQFYQFFYNSYGELARVELPTGGAFEYDMNPGSGVVLVAEPPQISRRVRERRVYADGSSGSTFESKTTYEVTSDSSPFDSYPWSSTVTAETTNQSGGVVERSRHFFEGSALVSLFKSYGADVYSVWNDGREKKTEALDLSGPLASATILRRTETTVQQRTTVSWWSAWCATHGTNLAASPPMDPRVTEIVTTIEPNGANLVSKHVFGYDDSVPFNNQNNLKEYAYGTGAPGALVRETQKTFVTSSTYIGTNVHLRSLTTRVSVFEGSTERSRTAFEYDNYTAGGNYAALTDRPNISGFDSTFGTQYTTRGNPTSSTRYFLVNGTVTGSISTFSQFDIAGNIVKAIDGRGFATLADFTDRFGGPDAEARANSGSTELNAAGKFSYAFPTLVTNALGHTVYTQFDYYLGKPVETEDANGTVSSTFYGDSLERPTQLIKGNNLSGDPKTQVIFAYSDVDRTITTTADHNTFNDTSPLKSQIVNDQMGRTIETRQYESVGGYITTKTEYDALGRVRRVSNPYRSGENVLWTTTVFDGLGRVTSVTTPDSAVITTSYSGNSITVTDQNGKQRKSVSDTFGRVTSIYEAPNDASYNYLTSYNYDVLDNLTTVTQGVQTRSFVYDSLGQLKSNTNPENGTTSYEYDGNGNVSQKTDARGVVSTYAYDALNRNTSITYTNDPAGTPNVFRYYDGWRDGVNYNVPYSKGKLWQTESTGTKASRTTTNSFDGLGSPLSLSQQFYNSGWGAAYTISRTYNLAGAVKSQTYPSGRVVNYTYDMAGRVYSFDGNLGGTSRTYSTGDTYSPLGGMTQEQFGTDTAIYNKVIYNSRGQKAEIRVGTYNATDNTWWNRGAIINHFSMNCWGACGGSNSSTPMTDNNGNLKKQDFYVPANDQISSYTFWWQGYDYDPVNRLQRVHEYVGGGGDWQQEYVYDRYGNRTLHQINTFGTGINKKDFTVNTSNNRLGVPSGLGGTMTYDNAGNLTVDTYSGFAVNRVFDSENRMTSETQSAGSMSYTYNGDGDRVRRNLGGVETWQVFGMDGELVAEYPANGAVASPQKEYGYRNGQLLIAAESGSSGVGGSPYGGTAAAVPGVIQTEHYDNGGEGFGYHDTTGGTHGQDYDQPPNYPPPGFRQPTDVDIYKQAGYSNSYIILGQAGDWTNYTVNVSTTGTYTLQAQVAWGGTSGSLGSFHVEVDGVDKTGLLQIPDTNWTFTMVTKTGVQLSAGTHVMRIVWDVNAPNGFSGDIDYLNFTLASAGSPYGGTAAAVPGVIQTEHYDNGGEGVGYHDTTPGTHGQDYDQPPNYPPPGFRQPTDVDIYKQAGYSNSYIILGQAGDWTNYTVNISTTGIYTLQAQVAWGGTSGSLGSFHVEVDGVDKTGLLQIPDTNWTFTMVTKTGVQLSAGTHVMRIVWDVNAPNGFSGDIDYLNFTLTTATGSSAQVQWLVTDHLGTPRMVIDQTGSLANVKRHDYLPFGEELSNQGLRTPALGYGSADGLRQKFTSKERDSETGLDYFGARYYGSIQGRFVSGDPVFLSTRRIINPQIWNLYSYVGNNPLSYIDPTGEYLVKLGQHSDAEIDKRRKEIDEEKKAIRQDKSISKKEQDEKRAKLEEEKKMLGLEKEGNQVVGALLNTLDSVGQRNGLQLSDFTLSTDTKNDFAGQVTPDAMKKITNDQAFVIQNDPKLGGTIYVRTQPSDGFYQLSRTYSDFKYYGATAIRHEQEHLQKRGENVAYRVQDNVMHLFKNKFQNPDLYKSLDEALHDAIKKHP